jgi:hypothetical protein
MISLEGWSSTIELYPHYKPARQKLVPLPNKSDPITNLATQTTARPLPKPKQQKTSDINP